MKAIYDNRPAVLEAVGNGSYLYRWDITESVPVTETDGQQTAAQPQWECEEVTVWKPLTANKILEAAIASGWSASREQKLVNDYNAAMLGLTGGSKTSDEAKQRIEAYRSFLEKRNAIKAQVDADCTELGIR